MIRIRHRVSRAKSRPLGQTYIGFTAQNTITIVERLKVPRAEAFILRLPDELLFTIFELAIFESNYREPCYFWHTSQNRRAAKTLILTCHRFKQIALPLLYHNIIFENILRRPFNIAPPTKAVKYLHYTLQKNPLLWQYCRVLQITINEIGSGIDPANFCLASDFVTWLTKVRCLAIQGGFGKKDREQIWALVRNVCQHMGELEHLSIAAQNSLDLNQLLEHVDIPSLKKLVIGGVASAINGTVKLEPKRHRTASFSTFSLGTYKDSTDSLAQLLLWPKQLSHFYFTSFYSYERYIDLPMLHLMLLPHRDTLRTIHIGYLHPHSRGPLFDTSDFPNLEVLALSRWQMKEDLDFSSAEADLLLAPNLKKFIWDFTTCNQHPEDWTDFGKREEDWIRELARAAIKRKTALETIKIIFRPDEFYSKEEDGYPWDRMDRIRDEIQPHGILLQYNPLFKSKEEWLQEVREQDARLWHHETHGDMRSRGLLKYFPPVARQ